MHVARFPRLALGTIQPAADTVPMLWALASVLQRHGLDAQVFDSRARIDGRFGTGTVCGQPVRHLDSWLMSPDACRANFMYGAAGADLSVVVGELYGQPSDCVPVGGNLDLLCQWLRLPRLIIVDVSQLTDCRLPPRPENAAGILLDRIAPADVPSVQTTLESIWKVPVLGALPDLARERAIIQEMTQGQMPGDCLCKTLGQQLDATLRVRRLLSLADGDGLAETSFEFRPPATNLHGLVVAVAYDDAFFGYFPDSLDLLELAGATVTTFSPLQDESLPRGTDVVYIGGGVPHRFADTLAANQCLTLALRDHVRNDRRLYAESGGLAYLCAQLELPDGQCVPMAGVFAASAIYRGPCASPRATEITLARDHWFAPRGAKIRGYCDQAWHIKPLGRLTRYASEPGHGMDLVGRQSALGSRLQVSLAAQPDFLRRFCAPVHRPSRPLPAL